MLSNSNIIATIFKRRTMQKKRTKTMKNQIEVHRNDTREPFNKFQLPFAKICKT